MSTRKPNSNLPNLADLSARLAANNARVRQAMQSLPARTESEQQAPQNRPAMLPNGRRRPVSALRNEPTE